MIIVSLIGLKKCGKTTTAEALIGEFRSRGMKVGGVKWMIHDNFTIDTEGKDTWRHKQAGADFVISISRNEMAFVQDRPERPGLDDVLALAPDNTDILICEGLRDTTPNIIRVVVAKAMETLNETFEVRQVKGGVIALSGIMANETLEHPEYPVFNCTMPGGAKGLADLILSTHEEMEGTGI